MFVNGLIRERGLLSLIMICDYGCNLFLYYLLSGQWYHLVFVMFLSNVLVSPFINLFN